MNRAHHKITWLAALSCTLCCFTASGQLFHRLDEVWKDSAHISNHPFINNIFEQAKNSIKKSNNDTAVADLVLSGKSEDPYMPYKGKIIRHIKIEKLDFERSFTDTSKRFASLAGKVADATHTSTRDFVIRNNLFIKENMQVNPYQVADNERYLRNLNYINDARILIKPIPDNPDSVDVIVITKDLFNILVGGASNGLNHVNLRVVDVNLAGMGQDVEATGLYDYNRNPNWGYGGTYTKNNVGHSFVNASVGYSTMNISNYTHEEETTEFFRLDRPLVSPNSHFAGGLLLSHNTSYNLYNQPDSTYFKYKYNLIDGWIGYNIGIRQLTATNNGVRDRRFFSVRYYNYQFNEVPEKIGNNFDPVFNSKQGVLGQITFFRQDYYKTQYIYGFGTTEDLPYGYNISVTGGWTRQLDAERPYAGLNALKYIATDKGDFIQLFFRTGGYLYHNNIQDGSALIGGTAYSRIIFWNSTKIRQYINISYTHLYNKVTSPPLRIDNGYGIREFLSDSAYGTRRLSLSLETEFYLKYKILGFQFAPFPFVDLSVLTPEQAAFDKSNLYTGFGGGIRTRNENLVFGTIEFRFYVFPIAPQHTKGFKILITSNLRYRYNSNLITEPDAEQVNIAP